MVVGTHDLDSLWSEVGLVVVMVAVVVNATEEGGGESGNLHLLLLSLLQGEGVPPPRPSRRLFVVV